MRAMTNMAGPVAGPMLGGWITDDYSWPWIFLVNAPVGLFVVASSLMLFKGHDTPCAKLPVDVAGLVLLAIAIGCLQITLDRGRILDWFSSPVICTTAILSALGFVLLVGLYFAALVLIPLWLQTDMGYNATWAGLVTAPMGVFGILLAPLLGKWGRCLRSALRRAQAGG
ncbi:MFS transporter [Burkholderia sp. Bp9126]|nr:MFS transporter [Burkholderia sp. Bp9126]